MLMVGGTGMAKQTQWGELDYLIVDMPPGTGDVQLTLAQQMNFSASVLVTTPQLLSYVDVVRGIDLFDKVKVPTIAVVENMSSFLCHGCKTIHYPFGKGHLDNLSSQFGIQQAFRLPICEALSSFKDAGGSKVLSSLLQPDSSLADPSSATILASGQEKTSTGVINQIKEIFGDLARAVVSEVETEVIIPHIMYDENSGKVQLTRQHGGEASSLLYLDRMDTRCACKCALCVDEMTGKPLLRKETIKEGVHPVRMKPVGNYAVAVEWSDGHKSSIYPWSSLVSLA